MSVSVCVIIRPIPSADSELRYLLEDCLSGKPERWSEFVALCHRIIQTSVARSIRRCGQWTPELAEDLVQDTYLRLCANNYRVLRDFRYTESGGLIALLEAVAVSATFDYFRRRIAAKRGAGQDPVPIDRDLDDSRLEADGPVRTEQTILFEQIDRRLQAIVPADNAARDRRIFWLYYRHGFSANEIASLPGLELSAKGVESILHRLTTQLRDLLGGLGRQGKGESA